MIDTHAHLDFSRFEEDREEVLARAASAGVRQIVSIGTDAPTSRRTVALAHRYRGLWAAVGLHPHDAARGDEETYRTLRELGADPRVVAVGEQGLDFYYDNSPRDAQRQAFRRQLRLALDLELPIIIHSRDAYDDTWTIIENEWLDGSGHPRGPGGVLHCFSGDLDFAQRCVEAGFLLGIGGIVTFKSAERLRDVVRHIPLRHLVLETDCPYLAPRPHRGSRNEPAYIRLIAEQIAEVKDVAVADVARETTSNARAIFGLPEDELLPTDR